MATLHLLGTGAAVSDPHRTTTMLAFAEENDTVVVDCGGDVVQRLLQAGVDLDTISSLIITHEHPDHVSGFPLFMEKIWLAGRRRPLPVHGIREALDQARRCFQTFNTSGWDGLPDILWNEVPYRESAKVLESDHWAITASPGQHSVPVVGIRVTVKHSGSTVAYSCDTEPYEPIVRLATGAPILVHEATGAGKGHSSAKQASDIAARADVDRLLLVHLPPGVRDDDLREARAVFEHTELGQESGTYDI